MACAAVSVAEEEDAEDAVAVAEDAVRAKLKREESNNNRYDRIVWFRVTMVFRETTVRTEAEDVVVEDAEAVVEEVVDVVETSPLSLKPKSACSSFVVTLLHFLTYKQQSFIC